MRDRKLATLKGCLLLPLTPDEKKLMRDIVFEYERGTEQTWGEANQDRYDEVAALFTKCEGILKGVQQAAL